MQQKIDIERLAALAGIELDGDDTEELKSDMHSIIALMDTLRDIELPDALQRIEAISLAELRADEIAPSLAEQEALGDRAAFSVPRVVEQGGES